MPKPTKVIVHIPQDLTEEFKGRNHQKPEEWKKLIYYKTRKDNKPQRVKLINEMCACRQYRAKTFYKIGSLSKKDNIWDYYRILKDTKKPNIGIKVQTKPYTKKQEELIKKILIKKSNTDPVQVTFD
tara:strand:+ start:31 stop:411 length:381 start_codon:yes stop_codon:yes gene_type:complete